MKRLGCGLSRLMPWALMKLHENVRRVRDFLYRKSQSVFPVLYGRHNHC